MVQPGGGGRRGCRLGRGRQGAATVEAGSQRAGPAVPGGAAGAAVGGRMEAGRSRLRLRTEVDAVLRGGQVAGIAGQVVDVSPLVANDGVRERSHTAGRPARVPAAEEAVVCT